MAFIVINMYLNSSLSEEITASPDGKTHSTLVIFMASRCFENYVRERARNTVEPLVRETSIQGTPSVRGHKLW